MTKDLKKERPKGTSIRLPNDILEKVQEIQIREHIDRTTVIVKAVEYWVSVDGRATCDGAFIQRLDAMDTRIAELTTALEASRTEIERLCSAITELKEISTKQDATIDFLVNRVLGKD